MYTRMYGKNAILLRKNVPKRESFRVVFNFFLFLLEKLSKIYVTIK